MLSNFLPGQEAGNVKFVIEGGFGQYSPKSSVISIAPEEDMSYLTLSYASVILAKLVMSDAPSIRYAIVQNAGDECYISDHTDIGIGMNAKTENAEAARTFLNWVGSAEFASLYANSLPGFFSLPRPLARCAGFFWSREPSARCASFCSMHSC